MLLVGEREADVKVQARYARKFGYRPLTKRLLSDVTGDWYQWFKRWGPVIRKQKGIEDREEKTHAPDSRH